MSGGGGLDGAQREAAQGGLAVVRLTLVDGFEQREFTPRARRVGPFEQLGELEVEAFAELERRRAFEP